MKERDVAQSNLSDIESYADKTQAFILQLQALYSAGPIFYNIDYAWLPCVKLRFTLGKARSACATAPQITYRAISLKLLSKCYDGLRQFLNVASYSADRGLEYV
jgi:hypothetical protein